MDIIGPTNALEDFHSKLSSIVKNVYTRLVNCGNTIFKIHRMRVTLSRIRVRDKLINCTYNKLYFKAQRLKWPDSLKMQDLRVLYGPRNTCSYFQRHIVPFETEKSLSHFLSLKMNNNKKMQQRISLRSII